MINNLSKGYKDSPLGIIPEEWEVKRLGDYVTITSGESPSLYELKTVGRYPFVKVEDMNNCTKYQIRSREYSDDDRNIVSKGSIIFPKRGAAILNNKVRIAQIDLLMDSNMMAITVKESFLDNEFLYYTIIKEQLFKIADTSTIPQINNKHIIPYRFRLPLIGEQLKIVSFLNTWDTAIDKLSELIEKLKLRKRALIQQLLTGKKRLPGFTGEWKKVKLGEVFNERNETNHEDLPLLSITGDKGVIYQSDSDKRDISNTDKSKYKRICPNDIGYNTMRMWQGRSALSKLEGIVSPAYTIVTPKNHVNVKFMAMLIQQPRVVYGFWTHSQGLVSDTLNCKYPDFCQVKVRIPIKEEQTEITSILVNADKEIELANEKLTNLQSQKRGLMQQLLTGKKRIKELKDYEKRRKQA